MKIEEAIEILTIMATPSNPELLMNKHLALKLGIAALKRVNEIRNGPFGYTEFLLPGETESLPSSPRKRGPPRKVETNDQNKGGLGA